MHNENSNNDQTKPEEKNKPENELKRCTFFNSGHCKYKMECKFSHLREVCKVYLEEGKTDIRRSVSGCRGKVAAEELTVTICMLLLLEMMGNQTLHTNISHVLDAEIVLTTAHV